jgi:kynurenine formamidase
MADKAYAPFKANGLTYYDLTHVAPMFEAKDGDLTTPDLDKPVEGSVPICNHGLGARVEKPDFPAKLGTFHWGMFSLDEHFATHVDSQCHFITSDPELKIDNPDQRYAHEFTLADLIGPLVYIDISDRVEKELAKNGGQPSPDIAVTDFSNSSEATVRLADIEAVEDYITDGAYLVFNTGWERTYRGPDPEEGGWFHPYNNGLNHPGVTPEVTDWLVALEARKGIKINGLVADNIGIESGASLLGEGGSVAVDPPRINGPYLHAVGLQRGWKLVENVCNLGALGNHLQGTGTLFVGASRIIGVSGAPARIIAMFSES